MSSDDIRVRNKLPIVYSKNYSVHFAGLEKLHPFDAAKGKHVHQLLCTQLTLNSGDFYSPTEITKEQLLRVHTPKYLKSLKWSANVAGIAEVPALILMPNFTVQSGYLRPMRYQTAGSILAGKLALEYGWAINLGGGFHHCCSYKGGGFCPYADITLLILRLFELESVRVKQAMIIDLDAHQGNGHERDFKNVDSVYILDMYNASIYPKDNEAKTSIRCGVELRHMTEDAYYLGQLNRCLIQAVSEFKPDVVIFNAGTDILKGDPLGNLAITADGVIERDLMVFSTFRALEIPVVMLLSGGYMKSSKRVIVDSIVNLRRQGWLRAN
ncbi:histone deacetylase 11 isoform X1 [Drosophila sulfurigaster albostrigata]|uniref:histone deacetylase 11 isoform X1 n=1 Tax=Drosophila sulfurigaster albostrigata TaxID=89887 RepID=UPI002D21BA4F|nr:histone deacetylase 11 isoform X1 [Drosophila sulfurigaster albostrigata]